MKTEIVHNLSELIRSRFFESFQSDRLGNSLFLNDPDRADRIFEAAADCADGSMHAEAIADFRDANELAERALYRPMFAELGFGDNAPMLAEALTQAIADEIDEVENFHEKQGTLQNQIG